MLHKTDTLELVEINQKEPQKNHLYIRVLEDRVNKQELLQQKNRDRRNAVCLRKHKK